VERSDTRQGVNLLASLRLRVLTFKGDNFHISNGILISGCFGCYLGESHNVAIRSIIPLHFPQTPIVIIIFDFILIPTKQYYRVNNNKLTTQRKVSVD